MLGESTECLSGSATETAASIEVDGVNSCSAQGYSSIVLRDSEEDDDEDDEDEEEDEDVYVVVPLFRLASWLAHAFA